MGPIAQASDEGPGQRSTQINFSIEEIGASDQYFDHTASKRLLPRRGHLGKTPMSSASSARCAANVWITSSSLTSITCVASCRHIFNIITKSERISRSTKIAPRRAQYTRQPLARSLPSRRSVACIIATNVAPREPFRQPNRRHVSVTVSLGCNGAQNPCMVPRSQQRPMFYSTNKNSSVAISSANRFPDRIDF
jgi:hypothetical protein